MPAVCHMLFIVTSFARAAKLVSLWGGQRSHIANFESMLNCVYLAAVWQKLTAAIGRNIERTTGKQLMQNGGDLSLLKRVADASKSGGDEASRAAATPKFDTRKQFRLTS